MDRYMAREWIDPIRFFHYPKGDQYHHPNYSLRSDKDLVGRLPRPSQVASHLPAQTRLAHINSKRIRSIFTSQVENGCH